MDDFDPTRFHIPRDGFDCPLPAPGTDLSGYPDAPSLRAHIDEAETGPQEKTLADELSRCQEQRDTLARQLILQRLDFAGVLVRVEAAGLHKEAGFDDAEDYLASRGKTWPGPTPSRTMG